MCHLSCTHAFLSTIPAYEKRRSMGVDEGIAKLYVMNISLIVGNLCKRSREVLLSYRYCRHSKLIELVSDSANSLQETLNEKNASVSAVEVEDEVVQLVRFFICAAAVYKSNSRMRATEVDGIHNTRRLRHGCLK